MKNAATARRIARSVQIEMALEKRAIGRRIADLRIRQHLTQEDAADQAGVALRTWQDWEYGKTQPRYHNLERALTVLQATEEQIFGTPAPPTNGNTPDVVQRLERIEQLLVDLAEDITGSVLPRLDDLATRDEAPEATQPQSAPTTRRRAQRP